MKGKIGFCPLIIWVISSLGIIALAGSYGCANIGSPTGGAIDSLPPVLLKMYPENYTVNFNNKTITLNFDEYVDLENPFEKLIINPPFDRFPLVEKKLRTVTIKLKDTLEANTTYSWRFDHVIKDVNEGNEFENFTYVFSSGPTLDSASFAGRVISAETGKIDSTLLVVLHSNLSDTAIKKTKPRYVTKLDGSGFFRFTYLAPGEYNVFALKDDGMKRYSDTTEPFAFLNKPIQVSENTESVEMLFFNAAEKKADDANQPSTTPKQKTDEDEEVKKPKRLTVTPVMGGSGSHDILDPLVLNFSGPLQAVDSSLIFFTDTLMKPVGAYALNRDTASSNRLILSHNWKMDTYYQIVFLKGAATDSAGLTFTRNDTLIFKTKAEKEYGSIKVTLNGLDFELNPVLRWLQAGEVIKSIPLTGNTYSEKIFRPGDYEINLLLDANKNGRWDTGNYGMKWQPERVLEIPKKINVRGNWENEFIIDLNAPEEKK